MRISSDKKFIVFAGPNGAGKSFHSKLFLTKLGLPISAYDWDRRFYESWRQFGFDPLVESGVMESETQKYHNHVETRFSSGLPFAYETNFHHERNIKLLNRALDNGYETFLYFFFLQSTEQCRERVNLRVARDNGHNVKDEDIHERFWGSFNILEQTLKRFDYVALFDSSESYEIKLMMSKSPSAKPDFFAKIPRLLFEKVPSLKFFGVEESLLK